MRVEPAELGELALRTEPTTDLEAELAAAFARRRATARLRIAERLGGFDLIDAVEGTDDGVAALVDIAPAFHRALVREDVSELVVSQQRPSHPHLAHIRSTDEGGGPVAADLVLDGRTEAEVGLLLPGPAYAALRAGETLIAHRTDQYDTGALRALCEDLEQQLGTTIGVNTYFSHRGAEGFGAHWDDHTVLVVQVHGRKLWDVFEPRHLSPIPHYVQKHELGPPAWSGVLLPGQALLIPRGWAHRVSGLDERSVHHTIALNRPTFLDVVDAGFAAAGPFPAEADHEGVAAWIQAACSDAEGLAARVIATNTAAVGARPRSGFAPLAAWERGEPVRLEVLAPGRAIFVGDAVEGVQLAWSGAVVHLSEHEAATLVGVVAAGPLAAGQATDAQEVLVEQLLACGLARVQLPEPVAV